jgi:hypothetical protein
MKSKLRSLKGALASKEGKGMSFRKARQAAAAAVRRKCMIAAAVAENLPVATFDQDFRKFRDVRVAGST